MKVEFLSMFCVAGYSVRTNNNIEATDESRIAQLWSRFMSDNPAAALTQKLGDEIYAVYSDYETNHTGDYTLTVGYRVPLDAALPAGLAAATVIAGRYSVLSSEIGPASRVVPELWRSIWSMTASELGGVRTYNSDFELYDHKAINPSMAQVEIYLGISG